jgi:hypothetical protein
MILSLGTIRCLTIIAISSCAALGCTTSATMQRGDHEIISRPSRTDAIMLRRAEAAMDRLRPAYHRPATVHLSAELGLAAYSWRNGRIVLTRDLVNILDDDELCAAIAHEIGHLICDEAENKNWLFALRGVHGLAEEEAADANGRTVLRQAGRPEVALTRVLSKIRRAKQTPSPLRQQLAARMALLPRERDESPRRE